MRCSCCKVNKNDIYDFFLAGDLGCYLMCKYEEKRVLYYVFSHGSTNSLCCDTVNEPFNIFFNIKWFSLDETFDSSTPYHLSLALQVYKVKETSTSSSIFISIFFSLTSITWQSNCFKLTRGKHKNWIMLKKSFHQSKSWTYEMDVLYWC